MEHKAARLMHIPLGHIKVLLRNAGRYKTLTIKPGNLPEDGKWVEAGVTYHYRGSFSTKAGGETAIYDSLDPKSINL